jgi:hypothetical protein
MAVPHTPITRHRRHTCHTLTRCDKRVRRVGGAAWRGGLCVSATPQPSEARLTTNPQRRCAAPLDTNHQHPTAVSARSVDQATPHVIQAPPPTQHTTMAQAPQQQPDLEAASQPLLEPHGGARVFPACAPLGTRSFSQLGGARARTFLAAAAGPPAHTPRTRAHNQQTRATGSASLRRLRTPGCRTQQHARSWACYQQSHSRCVSLGVCMRAHTAGALAMRVCVSVGVCSCSCRLLVLFAQ